MAPKDSIIVIKIGGSTLGNNGTILEDILLLQAQQYKPVVIHGGGKLINKWMERQGIFPRFVNGLRVTDEDAIDIVVSVLGGVINKRMVVEISNAGGKAIGICGIDGRIFESTVQDPSLGYVGKITKVNDQLINDVLSTGYIPLIAPLGINSTKEPPGSEILNINADAAAGEIASALKAERLVFLTDVEGVLDVNNQLIEAVSLEQGKTLLESGIVKHGMIPKLEAGLKACGSGSNVSIINGNTLKALLHSVHGKKIGTIIKRGDQ